MMKERKKLIAVSVIVILITAVISLDCGIFTGDKQCRIINNLHLNALARRVQGESADYLIMIDPGHGGMDGGASCSDGTFEKDINLLIAGKLAAAAAEFDCRTVLTRETDAWLCSTEEGTIRSRKTADLIARRELIRKYSPDVLVSIHLNSFKEDPGVSGAQVFYPSVNGDPEVLQQCKKLAETIQNKMNEELQQDKPRSAMVRDGVFLFKEVKQPMVIVECGFMSNPDEAEKLKNGIYQEAAAQCIMEGIAEFSRLKKPVPVEIIDSSE